MYNNPYLFLNSCAIVAIAASTFTHELHATTLDMAGASQTITETNFPSAGISSSSGTPDLTINLSSSDQTVSGIIASPIKDVILTGSKTLTLSGNNTYTGATTINSGSILRVASTDNIGGTNELVLAGGALKASASFTLSKPISLLTNSTLDLEDKTITITGQITPNNNTLTISGSGTCRYQPGGTGSSYTLSGTVDFSPQLANISDIVCFELSNINVQLPTATNTYGDTVSYSLAGLQGGLNFDATSNTVSGAAVSRADTTCTYTATNSYGSVQKSVALYVMRFWAPDQSVTFNNAITVSPQMLNQPTGEILSIAAAHASSGSVQPNGTTLIYTPAQGFVGTDIVTYTAYDARLNLTSTANTFNVTVAAPTSIQASSLGNMQIPFGGNTAFSMPAISNSATGDSFSFTAANSVRGGNILSSGSSLTYTAPNGFVGTDTISYIIRDTLYSLETNGAVTITVAEPTSVSLNTVAGQTTAFNTTNTNIVLSAIGNAVTGDTYAYYTGNSGNATTAATTHGVAAISGTTLTYTPTAGYVGTDTVTYYVKDTSRGNLQSSAQTFSIATSKPTTATDISTGGLYYNTQQNDTISAVLSGSGALTHNSPYILTLSAANTYTGATIINSGATLIISDGSAIANSDVIVNSGGIFTVSGGSAFKSLTLDGGTFKIGTSFTLGKDITLTGNAIIDLYGHALILSGSILQEGTTPLNISIIDSSSAQTGTITFTSACILGSTYTGTTTFEYAKLQNGQIPASSTSTTGVDVDQDATFEADAQISGTGVLIKLGDGTLLLNNQSGQNNNYTGGTVIKDGVIEIEQSTDLGTGVIEFLAESSNAHPELLIGADMTLTNTLDFETAGIIDTDGHNVSVSVTGMKGTGAVRKIGKGELTLTGGESTGTQHALTVENGAIAVNSEDNLGHISQLNLTGGSIHVKGNITTNKPIRLG